MKRSIIIIMTLCVIGLIGCNKQSQQNPVNITANFGNGSAMPSQTVEGDKSDVKVDTNAVISPDPNKDIEQDRGDPLPLQGWYSWPTKGIITLSESEDTENEYKINTNGLLPDSAGLVNEHLSTSLRGKKIILYFSDTKKSSFSEGRMVKVECDEKLIEPSANALPVMGFLPVRDTPHNKGIEFNIPNSFNGKLNFTFYQANLRDLKISVYYK